MSRDPIERSLEIEQAQLRGFARSVAEVEWLLLILVVLYLFIANPALARSVGVLGVLLGFAGFVLLFRYGRPFKKHTHFKLAFEILVMLAFLTAVLAVSGGVRSPLVNLYLLPIVTAALALGKRAAALVVAVVCLCYLLVGVLDDGVEAVNGQFAIAAVGVLAPFILVAFCTTLLVDNINTAKNRIRALSDRDELTSLYNMRAFGRLAEQEHDSASRTGRVYSILMIDIEHLKSVNDTYGHEAGSRAVKLVAEALLRLTRSTDVVARYGGDEFVALLPGASLDATRHIAEALCDVISTLAVSIGRDNVLRLSISVGAVSRDPDSLEDAPALLERADSALLEAKRLGRNRAVSAP